MIYEGVRKGYNGNTGNVGAVFPLAYVPDVAVHFFVGVYDLPFVGPDQPLNKGRSRPAAILRRLLVHEAGRCFIVKWSAVNLKDTGGDSGHGGIGG